MFLRRNENKVMGNIAAINSTEVKTIRKFSCCKSSRKDSRNQLIKDKKGWKVRKATSDPLQRHTLQKINRPQWKITRSLGQSKNHQAWHQEEPSFEATDVLLAFSDWVDAATVISLHCQIHCFFTKSFVWSFRCIWVQSLTVPNLDGKK